MYISCLCLGGSHLNSPTRSLEKRTAATKKSQQWYNFQFCSQYFVLKFAFQTVAPDVTSSLNDTVAATTAVEKVEELQNQTWTTEADKQEATDVPATETTVSNFYH